MENNHYKIIMNGILHHSPVGVLLYDEKSILPNVVDKKYIEKCRSEKEDITVYVDNMIIKYAFLEETEEVLIFIQNLNFLEKPLALKRHEIIDMLSVISTKVQTLMNGNTEVNKKLENIIDEINRLNCLVRRNISVYRLFKKRKRRPKTRKKSIEL